MIVSRSSFFETLEKLKEVRSLAIDTETTGLRSFHGDQLFSIIIATDSESYYFNFQDYDDVEDERVLPRSYLEHFKPLFSDPSKIWDFFRAKFDLHMLAREGLFIAGIIHCCQAIALVEYNAHGKGKYSLEDCAGRLGVAKDDAVEEYIAKNGLWEWVNIPGKKKREKNKFYSRVPFDIIVPYGENDGRITKHLGKYQREKLEELDNGRPARWPSILRVLDNERRLTKTVFRMEHQGVKVDRPYCVRAASYESSRFSDLERAFKKETNRSYSASNPLFQEIFASEKEKWERTKPSKTKPEGGWSFESDVLAKFENPVAKIVLQIRDAKSKSDYYHGLLYHADRDDMVHSTFNPDGANHGRFSSSDPNLQNLTDEEGSESEFTVRRAIIPPPGYILIMPDYDQMEYRLMLDYAAAKWGRETELVRLVKSGLDVHEATAQLATSNGTPITRGQAKTTNFLTIYGGGNGKLASDLKCTLEQAKSIRQGIFDAAPEVRDLIRSLMNTAESRGFIFNWFGRRCYFPDPNKAYRAPNYCIAGGCADVVKVAMNEMDEMQEVEKLKSKLVLTIHDELPWYVHESEVSWLPRRIHHIMESVYPHKYLPLTAAMEWSEKSLGDKKKGFPV